MRNLAARKKSRVKTNSRPAGNQKNMNAEAESKEAVSEEKVTESVEQASEEKEDIKEEVITEEILGEENAEENEAEESSEDTAEDADNSGKKDAAQLKIEELEDKVKRQLAEFENFRKRTEKEKSGMFEAGEKSVLEKILPIVDNFERGIATIKEGEEENPHAAGMLMIYKQLMTELEKMDVKPIEAVGKEFDPDFHNAVMQCESDEYESGVVAAELLKGYTYRDSVLRHSMVSVVS